MWSYGKRENSRPPRSRMIRHQLNLLRREFSATIADQNNGQLTVAALYFSSIQLVDAMNKN